MALLPGRRCRRAAVELRPAENPRTLDQAASANRRHETSKAQTMTLTRKYGFAAVPDVHQARESTTRLTRYLTVLMEMHSGRRSPRVDLACANDWPIPDLVTR